MTDHPPESWVRNLVLSWGNEICGTPYPVSLLGVEVELLDRSRCDALYAHWEAVGEMDFRLILTVVEVKRDKAVAAALIQTMQYMGKLFTMLTGTSWGSRVRFRGVIVAREFDPALLRACSLFVPGSAENLIQLIQITEEMKLSTAAWVEWGKMLGESGESLRGPELAGLLDHHLGDSRQRVEGGELPWTSEELEGEPDR